MPSPTPSKKPPNAQLDSQHNAGQTDSSDAAGDVNQLRDLLTKLVVGQESVDQVLSKIVPKTQSQLPVKGATVDLGRESRCGFGEVIYGEGKPADLISRIAKSQIDAGQNVLVTRVDDRAAGQIQTDFANAHHNPIARTLRISPENTAASKPIDSEQAVETIHVAVVTAGSTDAPVAQEAMETLAWMGIPYQQFDDIGVAGPQRLIAAVPQLRLASAVVVVAGMEGALPSVVGGHLSAPIFAVPTSVGYGATLGGLTPLLGMLSSCAASIAVVNIDAGFKGGYLAGLVANQIIQRVGLERNSS